MKKINILKSIGIILLISSFGNWDYSFYQILKVYIFSLSIYLAFYYGKKNNEHFIWIFGIIALVFNPILPIFFTRNIWETIDVFVIILFIYSIYEEKN